MEVKKAVLIGGVAVGGFLLGRALLQPQAPKQSPPQTPPDPGFDDGDSYVLCGYQFTKLGWTNKQQNDEYYVPRITAHILRHLADGNEIYAARLAEQINQWAHNFGLPRDLTLAIAVYRTQAAYSMEDAQIQTAITAENITTCQSQPQTYTNPLGPWDVPASMWPAVWQNRATCPVDLLSQTPWDRVRTATLVFTARWAALIKNTGKLESFRQLGWDNREAVCDVVDIARTFADLR